MKNKNGIVMAVIGLLCLCVAVSYSTAYYRVNMTYEENKPEENMVTFASSNSVDVTFDGGSDDISLENVLPGESVSKTYTLTNNSNTTILYTTNLSNINNTFTNKDIVYSLYEVEDDVETLLINETTLPSTQSESINLIDCSSIEKNTVKKFKLVLHYLETDKDQSEDMGKEASVTISLGEFNGGKCITNIAKLLSTITNVNGTLSTSLDGTIVDETDDKNVRYIGANPNNYVWFNCDDYNNPTEDTCERWRIIGLMNNVSTDNGIESLVKIVRASFIGDYAWDSKENGSYNNTWETSTIKTLLNDTYYNNGKSTQYYGGSSPSKKTAAFDGTGDTKGITSATKNLIQEVNWNVTAATYNVTALTYYTTTGLTSKYNIGLIDPSDYGYATDGGTTTRETCLNTTMGYDSTNEIYWGGSECYNNSWLFYSNPKSSNIKGSTSFYWTNRPGYGSSKGALYVQSTGIIYNNSTYSDNGVRPALYLKSNVLIQVISGEDGSYSSPYVLSV